MPSLYTSEIKDWKKKNVILGSNRQTNLHKAKFKNDLNGKAKQRYAILPPNPETKEGKEKEGKDGKKNTIVFLKLLKVDTEELLVPINLRLRRTPETH